MMTTAGWGRIENGTASKVLLKVEIPFVDKRQCSRLYSSAGVFLIDSQICAGGEGGKDSCAGKTQSSLQLVLDNYLPFILILNPGWLVLKSGNYLNIVFI